MNHRTPTLKAIITGQNLNHPSRFRNRREPQGLAPIGKAPAWMNQKQKAAWKKFTSEISWLNVSHTSLIEIACILYAKTAGSSELDVKALNLLRLILGQLGATPVDASKISLPEEEPEDPAEKYFRKTK